MSEALLLCGWIGNGRRVPWLTPIGVVRVQEWSQGRAAALHPGREVNPEMRSTCKVPRFLHLGTRKKSYGTYLYFFTLLMLTAKVV